MKYINHLIQAAKYTMMGIRFALKNENAARMELVAIVMALIAAHLISSNTVDYILLTGSVVLVFALELVNTAIEAIIDEDGRHTRLYGAAKDCGSAAVGVMVAFSLFIWLSLFLENILHISLWTNLG